MARLFETLEYGLAAVLIVGGSLYGLALYLESGAQESSPQSPPAGVSAPLPSPRPPMPAPPRIAAPLSAPLPAAAAAENYVRAGNKIYYLAPAAPGQADTDTYNSMRRNCYDAANANRDGEFPTMQQTACSRFADFARQKGWDTGPLPAYGTPKPQVQQQVAYDDQAQDHSGECSALFNKEQNLEAAMRAGYREPLGNIYRARQRELEEQLWKLRCPRR